MAGSLTWETDGSTYYSDELSDILRTSVQPLTKFRQFADVRFAKQLHRGDTYRWNRYSDVTTQGRRLREDQPMPQTDFTAAQTNLTITEWGNSVPFSGKLQKLAKHDVIEIVSKALKNDARKAMDIAAWEQFKATSLKMVPTSGTSSTSITLTTNGTTAATNNIAMGADHIKAISDLMSERNIPPFRGDDYMVISHPTTFRPVKNDLETINQYTNQGIDRIFRGEVGRYEGFRFIEQNFIPKGNADNATTFDPYSQTAQAWANGKSSWAYFFGEDTVGEATVIPEEVRAKLAEDYGRAKGIAWYYLGGFGIIHPSTDDVAQERIFWWSSAT